MSVWKLSFLKDVILLKVNQGIPIIKRKFMSRFIMSGNGQESRHLRQTLEDVETDSEYLVSLNSRLFG